MCFNFLVSSIVRCQRNVSWIYSHRYIMNKLGIYLIQPRGTLRWRSFSFLTFFFIPGFRCFIVIMGLVKLFQIKDDPKNGFYVENLTEEYVTSYEDVTQILIKVDNYKTLFGLSSFVGISASHALLSLII